MRTWLRETESNRPCRLMRPDWSHSSYPAILAVGNQGLPRGEKLRDGLTRTRETASQNREPSLRGCLSQRFFTASGQRRRPHPLRQLPTGAADRPGVFLHRTAIRLSNIRTTLWHRVKASNLHQRVWNPPCCPLTPTLRTSLQTWTRAEASNLESPPQAHQQNQSQACYLLPPARVVTLQDEAAPMRSPVPPNRGPMGGSRSPHPGTALFMTTMSRKYPVKGQALFVPANLSFARAHQRGGAAFATGGLWFAERWPVRSTNEALASTAQD